LSALPMFIFLDTNGGTQASLVTNFDYSCQNFPHCDGLNFSRQCERIFQFR